RSEGFKGFGDPTVFLERRVRGGRHVEVQVIGDEHGTVWALGVRDCSVQRRHQKLIEETPSPALTADEDAFLRDAAARLARSAGYTGAGTVEFLFEPSSRRFSFLEVNARLQVEHPVTELVTGVDLVKLQLHVGRGLPLPPGGPPAARGHAVEARLNAEDPERDFAPSPGRLEVFRPAKGPGIRVDSGVEEGDTIPSEFDSMIAKVIAWGATREEAMARLRRALGETAVVIRGGASNKSFLQALLARPEMKSGDFDTEWLDRLGAAGDRAPGPAAAVALAQAAVDAYEAALDVERTRFWSTAARGRPEVGEEGGRTVELRFRGRPYSFRVDRTSAAGYRLRAGDAEVELEVERLGGSERRLTVAGGVHRVFSVLQGVDQLVEVDGVPHRISHGDAGVVRSPAPAVVVSLAVAAGDHVEPGQRLAMIEAMKMETAVVAEFAGRVAKVVVRPNVQVAAGAPLMVIEPEALAPQAAAAPTEAVSFAAVAAPGEPGDDRRRCLSNLERLTQLYLGWDVEPTEPARIIAQHGIVCAGLDPGDPEVRDAEDALVAAFVDVAALFGRRPDEEELADGRRTSEHYLFTYLRDLGGRGKGLPARFLDRLRRALAHYGIDDLAPSPELREALFRLSKAHRGLGRRQAPVLAVLDRRLAAAAELRGEPAGFHELLRRLVDVSRDRFAPVHDLAREVLYRFVDEPFLEAVRERALARAEEDLDRLLEGAKGEERERRMASLLGCPQPLQALFARRFADTGDEGRRLMLEVLVRRAYGLTAGQEVETRRFRGHAFAAAVAPGEDEDRPTHLVATHARWADFPRVAELAVKRVKKAPRKASVVADFFLHREEPLADRDAAAEEARALLVDADLPKRLERATVVITSAPGGAGKVDFFTFHPEGEGRKAEWRENPLLRGLHPATAERLQLWRLAGFELERLPAAEDVYAFLGRARDNPGDERLFLAAEVRDLTPADGDVRFPYLERVYHEALAVVRRTQARRPSERRLHWNRVTLYVRPPLDLPPSTLRSVVRRLAPAAEGLGLQKVVVFGRMARGDRPPRATVLEVSQPAGRGTELRFREPGAEPLETLSPYQSQVVRLRRRGLVAPYELVRLLAPPADASEGELPPGEFVEHDLAEETTAGGRDRAVPVDRPPGGNRANLVFGVVRNFTDDYPQGIARVLVASDPGRDMGALAEPECRRLIAALDLAEENGVPLEWFATSAGA
ncbi:MAG TPA: biotin/lipoyl-containing protein, partial [Thermoanaerobaculia bacterium]